MNVIFSPQCLEYGSPWHPESADRVRLAAEYLQGRAAEYAAQHAPGRTAESTAAAPTAAVRFDFLEPTPATEADILKVHAQEHVINLKALDFYDGDSPAYPHIFKYAALSAGGAIAAARHNGFSLMRPPGHHAGRSRVAGFCYLNNVAIAVRSLDRKTLIIDIDGHHGDGTQSIFLHDPAVTYVSLHRSPLYPGSGLESIDNCHNYPLPALCGDDVYLETLGEALSSGFTADIEQIAVSAGFDAYENDPLASLGLSTGAYRRIGERIGRLGPPVFAALEGGYDAPNLGPNIEQLILGLSGEKPGKR